MGVRSLRTPHAPAIVAVVLATPLLCHRRKFRLPTVGVCPSVGSAANRRPSREISPHGTYGTVLQAPGTRAAGAVLSGENGNGSIPTPPSRSPFGKHGLRRTANDGTHHRRP